MTDDQLHFAYWSDPLCIWAYVAQDKLDSILQEWGDRLDVEYRVVPVFGSVPWRFSEGTWAAKGIDHSANETLEKVGLDGKQTQIWDCYTWFDDVGESGTCGSNALWWDPVADIFLFTQS